MNHRSQQNDNGVSGSEGGGDVLIAKGNWRHFFKSTLFPLCIVVVVVCLYLPVTSRSTVPVAEPRPQPWTRTQGFVAADHSTHGSPSSSSSVAGAVDNKSGTIRDVSQNNIRHIFDTGSQTSTVSTVPSDAPESTCKPADKIVYIKTHKTGSTTVASILERFGYLRNLSFAMSKRSHVISSERLFTRSMAYQIPNRTRHDFDMLVNHVRYNRKEMDIAVPNAKYISIIRDPVTQLESAFGYFEMGKHLKIKSANPFQTFLSTPEKYYEMKSYFWTRSRNGQLYDFGFDHRNDEDTSKIQEKISQLSKEIDLMMITEYFDESLILLRRMMCWKYDDILYISNGIRSKSHRFAVTDAMADKIRAWSAADHMLYEHFNRTFWQKVEEYGPTFQEDLNHFRELEQDVTNTCIDTSKNNTGDRREDKLTLKNKSKYCEDLLRGDVPYTALVRRGMIQRAAEKAAARATS